VAEHKGKVKWFNNAKSYGLIGREDGPQMYSSTIRQFNRMGAKRSRKAARSSSTSSQVRKVRRRTRWSPPSDY
jgi:'Cold-shock' DNA-binding domain